MDFQEILKVEWAIQNFLQVVFVSNMLDGINCFLLTSIAHC